jgi:gluconokinase
MSSHSPVCIVVMGVQGIGKSTIGGLLAKRLNVPFVDGDRLHPLRNIGLMASGQALTDQDRAPWLKKVGESISENLASGGVVMACSALKHAYRDTLRSYYSDIFFVEPFGSMELVAARISLRDHEYMPPTLLESQYETLEKLSDSERGLRVSIEPAPPKIIEQVLAAYAAEYEDIK